jgi:DNA-binding SARP family transcriptional activator
LDFGILGPMEVTTEDGDVTPTAPKLRQVLALLLLRANCLVQTGEIIDELWGDCPPRTALSTLQTYIYKLRKTLFEGDSGEEMLQTKPSGYILRVPWQQVDLRCFERQSKEGALAVENGEPERAAVILSQALSLWRGPALADVVTGDLLRAYLTRLEESRMRALELRIEADLQLGKHDGVVGELKMLAATYPLHEGIHAKLMLALHRSGRRYEALNVYRQLREVLVEELGLEPSPALNRIHQALLSADPSLDSQPREMTAEPRPMPRPATPLHGLPADIPDFTGRENEVRQIERHLLDRDSDGTPGRVVWVCGAPATGKSALAIHTAHELGRHFPDGQLFCVLGSNKETPTPPELVMERALIALGVPPEQVPGPLEERIWLFHLRSANSRLLIVLDDATSAAQIKPFLQDHQSHALLITSRVPLVPGRPVISLEPLRLDESMRLLEKTAGADRIAGDSDATMRILRACGGLPLAIRAASCRLTASPNLPLHRLARDLEDHRARLDLLQFGELDVRSRYHNAYNQLSDRDKSVFRLISLFRHGFTAEEVARLLGQQAESAELPLSRLAEHHLLRSDRSNGHVRYELHELTRLYAQERLEDALRAAGATPEMDMRPLVGTATSEWGSIQEVA